MKGPEDYVRDRLGKYAQYFKGNEIFPIPEVSKVQEPRILSLDISDFKTRGLTGLQKDKFEEVLRTAGIPGQYFCRSFATWDVLLPTEEQAAELARSCIATKSFQLQPAYRGTRRIRVRVCNFLAYLIGVILAAFHSTYDNVEEVSQLRAAAGTAHGDYVFRVCFNREGIQTIPATIISQDLQIWWWRAEVHTASIVSRWATLQESALGKIQQPLQQNHPKQ